MITQNFSPEIGSASNRMLLISKYLNENFNVTILTTEPQYPDNVLYKNIHEWETKRDENLNVIRVRTKRKSSNKSLILRMVLYIRVFIQLFKVIKKKLSNEKYDFIFVSSPPLSIPLLGIYAKYKFQAKLILDVRDLWPETLRAIKGLFFTVLRYVTYPVEKIIYKISNTIIVNSEGFTPYVKKKVCSDKDIVYIPNSLTSKEFVYNKKYKHDGVIQIIYTGNLGVAQDLSVFLDLAEFFKDNAKIVFVLVGYGIYRNDIIKIVKEKKLMNVKILKPEPRIKTLKRMKSCDIAYIGLNNQTVFETVTPGKLIDYMGVGLPIISTTYGHSKKIIEDANAGIVLNMEDGIDSWAKAVEKLIYCSDARMIYGENARAYAYAYFNWEKNKQLLGKVFETLDE